MRALILGSGAREHTITWKLAMSRRIGGLFCAPGNAGMAEVGENLPEVNPESAEAVLKACRDKRINLVVVGPEGPLSLGIVDVLKKEGIPVIGPHQDAARLESSKVFSKEFMVRHGIPTAAAKEFGKGEAGKLRDYVNGFNGKLVIKKNGLASGKGVLESDRKDELIRFGEQILKTDSLLAEEFLKGFEISIFALTDGMSYKLLPPVADFKKAGENDTGPNTGGMGAICPVPEVGSKLMARIDEEIVRRTFEGLKKDSLGFIGVLYFGLMITDNGPNLLEYNVRFGDPEAQVVIPLIDNDIGNLFDAMARGILDSFPLKISDSAAVGVVVASPGYPGSCPKGLHVEKLPFINNEDTMVFHASTSLDSRNRLLTGGGRCFTAVGMHPDILEARRLAYKLAGEIRFNGAWFRKDIGEKFFTD